VGVGSTLCVPSNQFYISERITKGLLLLVFFGWGGGGKGEGGRKIVKKKRGRRSIYFILHYRRYSTMRMLQPFKSMFFILTYLFISIFIQHCKRRKEKKMPMVRLVTSY
jgi:hypothetical protein